MNDLAVITAANEQAMRQSLLDSVVASGKVALYEQTKGIVSIGDIEVYDTVAEARTAAARAQGGLEGCKLSPVCRGAEEGPSTKWIHRG